MNSLWEKNDCVFCDLQAAAHLIHRQNPPAARAFLGAADDTFEYLTGNPGRFGNEPIPDSQKSARVGSAVATAT